jgi:hypothetical protein
MSTKDEVSNFLQLGAKYELILTGLFDDVTHQRVVIDEVQSDFRNAQSSLKQTSIDFQIATAHLTKSFAQQNKRNVWAISLSLIALASNLMIWVVKL